MTNRHWELLQAVVNGEALDAPPVGFIIDSPWLPNWAGMSLLDYFTSETMWFDANAKAVETFPDVMFLPGFWSEFGMCTEPSAFGARTIFWENEFPFAELVITDLSQVHAMKTPAPRTDGLAPFMLKRLEHLEPQIVEMGHSIRFAVARGPLNIAAFLVGNTEFLIGMRMQINETHALLDKVTTYVENLLKLQAERFPSIDGVLILDDIVGFVSPPDMPEFAVPYLKRVFKAVDASVRFFHNDAEGMVCAPHLEEIGVNLFNYSDRHPVDEMREAAGDSVALFGNIPPRDVLAQGTPDAVRAAVTAQRERMTGMRGVVMSCGGGMPPGVPTENIIAFQEACKP